MNTPLQISMKLNVNIARVYNRIKDKDLKPLKKVAHNSYYDINDFYELKTRLHISIEISKKKMLIISYWITMRNHNTVTEIAIDMGLEPNYVRMVIKDYTKNDNSIIIKSKLC